MTNPGSGLDLRQMVIETVSAEMGITESAIHGEMQLPADKRGLMVIGKLASITGLNIKVGFPEMCTVDELIDKCYQAASSRSSFLN